MRDLILCREFIVNKKRAVYVILIVLLFYAGGVIFRNMYEVAAPVPLIRVPSFLKGIYEQDLYTTDIRTYGKCMTLAPYVYVSKSLRSWPEGRQMYLCWSEYPFLEYGEKRFERFLKTLKPHEAGDCRINYQYARYRITQFEPVKSPRYKDYDMVVVRDKGRVIGRWTEPAVGNWNFGKPDIRRLPDGRYMVANGHAVRYISEKRGKRVVECYFDPGAPDVGSFHVGPLAGSGGRPEVTILTDNVIRLAYKNGDVEHRKVRLSREDVDKNTEKLNPVFAEHNRKSSGIAGNKHLLWRNYKPKPLYEGQFSGEMWCFREGGEEPSAEAYSDMGFEAAMGVPDGRSRS